MKLSIVLAIQLAAQSASVYVDHQKVAGALSTGGVLLTTPEVRVAGGHRDKAGPLDTEIGTTIMYVTDGEATLVAAGRTPGMPATAGRTGVHRKAASNLTVRNVIDWHFRVLYPRGAWTRVPPQAFSASPRSRFSVDAGSLR